VADEDELEQDGDPGGSASSSPTPASVQSSPEYQALLRENRTLRRQAGAAQAAERQARTSAEEARQAAEADKVAVQQAAIRQMLGEEGLSLLQQLAEASENDPLEAARMIAQLRGVQSPPAAQAPTQQQESTMAGEQQAAAAAPPPPPSSGVDASTPIGSGTTFDIDGEIAARERLFEGVRDRNLNVKLRNTVRERDRRAAIMGFAEAAYLKALKLGRISPRNA